MINYNPIKCQYNFVQVKTKYDTMYNIVDDSDNSSSACIYIALVFTFVLTFKNTIL